MTDRFVPTERGYYFYRDCHGSAGAVARVSPWSDGTLVAFTIGGARRYEIHELDWIGPVTPPDVVREMREALEPFADEGDGWVPDWPDDQPLFPPGQGHAKVTLGDCRRARAVIAKLDGGA